MGMGNLQRMAMQMQQEMARVQAELETADRRRLRGRRRRHGDGHRQAGARRASTIDPSAVDPEDVEMLQDLVVAAVNDALRASGQLAEQKMGAVTGRPEDPGPRLSRRP